MWGVVVGDQDRIVLDAYIAFESPENVSGQVRGIPARKGAAQTLAHLVDGCLSQQSHSHLSVADIEIDVPRHAVSWERGR